MLKPGECTLETYEREFAGRHCLAEVISYWARRTPAAPAIIHHNSGVTVSYAEFEAAIQARARILSGYGFVKGDFLATHMPFSLEHIFIMYAAFRLGVAVIPVDMRVPAEIVAPLRPKAVFKSALPEMFDGEIPAEGPNENDGALVIFTTGSTGSPKPALLSHRNITCQNMCLGAAFQFEGGGVLVNLPPSHVGGQTELLMTAFFFGATAVVLDVFDPAKSLEAIERHKVTLLGQIPAMFHFEWRLSNYAQYDLSSLQTVVYGGQSVAQPFIDRMAAMAPNIGTGLGLTECAGFVTYILSSNRDIGDSLGQACPVYPFTIRQPMAEDGSAGPELPDGEIGHVCFQGPQTFLGYIGHPEATRQTISSDGWLYTGDMGSRTARGLKMAGRARFVIKVAGHQVFPGDIEAHFASLDTLGNCGAVGVDHKLLSEAVVLFAEPKPGAALSIDDLRRHSRDMVSFMRPLHYVLLEPGGLPLNRTAKVDTVKLQDMARAEIAALREKNRWDN